jgi:hypothetical protein
LDRSLKWLNRPIVYNLVQSCSHKNQIFSLITDISNQNKIFAQTFCNDNG